MGDINHVIERERRLGVDIEEQEIGRGIGRGSREGGMDLERCKVRDPDEGVEVIAQDEMDVPPGSL